MIPFFVPDGKGITPLSTRNEPEPVDPLVITRKIDGIMFRYEGPDGPGGTGWT